MFLISEIRPAPPALGRPKRTVSRGPWPVRRLNLSGVGERTHPELRAVARVLGPLWDVDLFSWAVGLFPWIVDR